VKDFTVKPPAQGRLKEPIRSYELHLQQKTDGPPLNHLGFEAEREVGGRGERGLFYSVPPFLLFFPLLLS